MDILSPTPAEKSKNPITASGSTKLSLEVKERVARQLALKRRDKVIPLKTGLSGEHAIHPGEQKNRDEGVHPALLASPTASSHVTTPSETENSSKQKSTRRGQAISKVQKSKSGKKEKQGPIGPIEYAQQLLEKAGASVKRKNSAIKFLEGKNIFYIGGDMHFAGERTRGRMDLVCPRILIRWHCNLTPLLGRL